jgi:hypothetical protein
MLFTPPETCGRHSAAGDRLRQLRLRVVSDRKPIVDPYPWLTAHLGELSDPVSSHGWWPWSLTGVTLLPCGFARATLLPCRPR